MHQLYKWWLQLCISDFPNTLEGCFCISYRKVGHDSQVFHFCFDFSPRIKAISFGIFVALCGAIPLIKFLRLLHSNSKRKNMALLLFTSFPITALQWLVYFIRRPLQSFAKWKAVCPCPEDSVSFSEKKKMFPIFTPRGHIYNQGRS